MNALKKLSLAAMMMLTMAQGTMAQTVDHSNCTEMAQGASAFMNDQYEEALTWVNKELQKHPDNDDAKLIKSMALLSLNRYQESIACNLDLLTRQNLKPEIKFLSHSLLTESNYICGNTEECVKHASIMIANDKADVVHYKRRSECYFVLGQLELAEKDAKKMLEMATNDDDKEKAEWILYIIEGRRARTKYKESASHGKRGQIYYLEGDFRHSYEEYKKTYEETGDNLYLYDVISVEDEGLDDRRGAIAALDKLIATGDTDLEDRAYYRKGWNQLYLKEYDKALKNLNIAIQKSKAKGNWSNQRNSLYTRALVYYKTNQMSKAQADWKAVIDIEAQNNSNDLSPHAYAWLGNKEKALELINPQNNSHRFYETYIVMAIAGETEYVKDLLTELLSQMVTNAPLRHLKREIAMEQIIKDPTISALFDGAIKRQDAYSMHNK